MSVTITESAYQSILAQAQKDAPVESCGYLLGTDKETATENYPMTNIDHAEEHFSFDPKEQFAAIKYARKNGLTIVGNWHSHPASPSRPSEEDKRLAYDPNILYFILSLAEAEPVLNAFRIVDGEVTEKTALRPAPTLGY
ncbi:MAG: M67 family metallopeptidase [Bacteroidaceae bacterium]|nr:M67 family metallopeptidase [Bacteroidaceae bacterium]